MAKTEDKERVLKAARESQTITFKGNSIRLSDFSKTGEKGVAWNSQSIEGEKSTTKYPLPCQVIVQNWRRN